MSLSLLGGVAQATPAQADTPQPVIGQPAKDKDGCARIEKSLPTLADWPKVDSRLKGKAGDEQRIAEILKGMTLEEIELSAIQIGLKRNSGVSNSAFWSG